MLNNLNTFFNEIKHEVLFELESLQFEGLQQKLLKDTIENYHLKTSYSIYNSPISLFYFISKNRNIYNNKQRVYLGCFCTLYMLSLDLFDDVQDNDLKGKIHEEIGPPIAINNAITLLFISLKYLTKVINLEVEDGKKIYYMDLFNKISLLAVKGQHKDLLGSEGVNTLDDVITMQKEKTSSISLFSCCAAIFSSFSKDHINKIEEITSRMILIVQIIDDIRDIYGKDISPDLMTGKVTFPIAIFMENSNQSEIEHFNNLKTQLPISLKEIRKILYDKTMVKCCEEIEKSRQYVHKELALLDLEHSSIRVLLFSIDSLASSLYSPTIINDSLFVYQNSSYWHDKVEKNFQTFFDNMSDYNTPEKPALFSWHLSNWAYDPKQNIIFYPDIEFQSEEILPIQSYILNIPDLKIVKDIIEEEAPFIMSHELFHYWRKQSNKITKDYWYEEWVVNCLGLLYTKTFLPDIYKKTINNTKLILEKHKNNINETHIKILNDISDENYTPSNSLKGYDMDHKDMICLQMLMIDRISRNNYNLNNCMTKFL